MFNSFICMRDATVPGDRGVGWGAETPLYMSLQERQWVFVKRPHWVNTIGM